MFHLPTLNPLNLFMSHINDIITEGRHMLYEVFKPMTSLLSSNRRRKMRQRGTQTYIYARAVDSCRHTAVEHISIVCEHANLCF